MKLDTTLEETLDIVNSCLKDTGCAFGGWPEKIELLCPIYAQGNDFAASLGGIVYAIRGLINGDIDYSRSMAEYAYTCSQCGVCDTSCYVLSIHRTDIKPSDFVRLLRSQLVRRDLLPEGLLKVYDQVLQKPRPGSSTPAIDNQADIVLYASGGTSPMRQKIFDSTLKILERMGHTPFALAAPSCGSAHYDLGFWKELPEIAATAWEAISPHQEKVMVFNDPHHMEFITRRYPEFLPQRAPLKGRHISQLIEEALISGRLKPTRKDRLRVSYHDPCRLGRGLGIYAAPRAVLSNLPGVELVEMQRSGATSFCCGAWAFGNYYPNLPIETARRRLEEFYATGADLLVTACPDCKAQFNKAMPSDQQDRVIDLAQLVDERTR